MPESEPQARSVSWRRIGCAGCGVFLLLCCLTGMGLGWPMQVAFKLVFGWVPFLGHVGPRITVNGASLASGVVCFALFGVGLHLFCAWLYGQLRPGASWSRRWSLAAVGVTVLSFAAGISAVGLVHQGVWLGTAKEPLTKSSWDDPSRKMSETLRRLWAHHGDPSGLRHGDALGRYAALDFERYELLVFKGHAGAPQLALVFPRDPALRAREGVLCQDDEQAGARLPAGQLAEALARLRPAPAEGERLLTRVADLAQQR